MHFGKNQEFLLCQNASDFLSLSAALQSSQVWFVFVWFRFSVTQWRTDRWEHEHSPVTAESARVSPWRRREAAGQKHNEASGGRQRPAEAASDPAGVAFPD